MSWVIRVKHTGEVVLETFNPRVVKMLNTAKYEAVPILEYLVSPQPSARCAVKRTGEAVVLTPEEQKLEDAQKRYTKARAERDARSGTPLYADLRGAVDDARRDLFKAMDEHSAWARKLFIAQGS